MLVRIYIYTSFTGAWVCISCGKLYVVGDLESYVFFLECGTN